MVDLEMSLVVWLFVVAYDACTTRITAAFVPPGNPFWD